MFAELKGKGHVRVEEAKLGEAEGSRENTLERRRLAIPFPLLPGIRVGAL
jgi:hypothetical protein